MILSTMRKLINEMSFDSRLLTGIPVVLAVVDAGSFVGAGNALGLTQSGVSRAIQRLEQRLGVRLFERNAKVIRLTDTGKRFCQEVGPLISRLQDVAEETTHSVTAVRGRLRVNVDPTFARLVLVPRIESFLETYPDLQIELLVRDELGDLIAEGFDAAVRFGEPQPSSLIVRRLLQVRVLTCASSKYLRRRGRPKAPNDLASREKAQKAQKGGLEIWQTDLHCGAVDRLKLSGSMATTLLSSYDSVFLSFLRLPPSQGLRHDKFSQLAAP
jgi:DNA-binding transcriptional LysR family regulator